MTRSPDSQLTKPSGGGAQGVATSTGASASAPQAHTNRQLRRRFIPLSLTTREARASGPKRHASHGNNGRKQP